MTEKLSAFAYILQSHEHILYQFSDLLSQFFLCSSVTELFVNKSFFYLKIHCLRKNAAQNIPSGIETKRKLLLVTDKLMPQWLFARKIEKHLLRKFVFWIDYGAITGGGGENYHL